MFATTQSTSIESQAMKITRLIAICCAVNLQPAFAAPLIHGDFIGQPQIIVTDGMTTGCGMRIIGLSKSSSPNDLVSGFDVSFTFYQDGRTLLKGLAFKPFILKTQKQNDLKYSYRPIKSFWLKSPENAAAVAINNKYINGETKNSLLYTADFGLTVGLLGTIMEGKELMVATYLAGEPFEKVYFGVVAMTDRETAQIAQCVRELKP